MVIQTWVKVHEVLRTVRNQGLVSSEKIPDCEDCGYTYCGDCAESIQGTHDEQTLDGQTVLHAAMKFRLEIMRLLFNSMSISCYHSTSSIH